MHGCLKGLRCEGYDALALLISICCAVACLGVVSQAHEVHAHGRMVHPPAIMHHANVQWS